MMKALKENKPNAAERKRHQHRQQSITYKHIKHTQYAKHTVRNVYTSHTHTVHTLLKGYLYVLMLFPDIKI